MKNERAQFTEEDLKKVTGGTPDEIKVKIKTLEGDNDDYQIKLTDTVQNLIDKYNLDDKDLGKVIGGNGAAGGICGVATGNTVLENCQNSDGLTGTTGVAAAGGICGTGSTNTAIENCYNTGKVDNGPTAGGIVGKIE